MFNINPTEETKKNPTEIHWNVSILKRICVHLGQNQASNLMIRRINDTRQKEKLSYLELLEHY